MGLFKVRARRVSMLQAISSLPSLNLSRSIAYFHAVLYISSRSIDTCIQVNIHVLYAYAVAPPTLPKFGIVDCGLSVICDKQLHKKKKKPRKVPTV